MPSYEDLLADTGILRAITNEVSQSEVPATSEQDMLARFAQNLAIPNAHVIQASKSQGASL